MSQLMILIAVVVGACAILAATGFRGRQTVVGIDLGTTYSVIGVNEAGKVTIIPGPDDNRLLPSVVSFLDDGVVVVGKDAVKLIESHPTSTIYGAKRFIGRAFSDVAVAEEAAEHQFQVVSGDNDDTSGVWFQIERSGHPSAVSPQAVGSHILAHLVGWATEHLGHKQVKQAVIAVPAKFDRQQRAATVEAFHLAGLKVIRILEEPTAAALAFGLQRKPNVNHILVYDMGGGTLDVSVLFVNDGSVDVIGSDGDDNLGGSDFDQCLAHMLVDKLGSRLVDVDEAAQAVRCDFGLPACAPQNLYPLSESMKRQLTDDESASVRCMRVVEESRVGGNPQPKRRKTMPAEAKKAAGGYNSEVGVVTGDDSRGEKGRNVCQQWESMSLELERTEYEQHCEFLFDRGLLPVSRLLDRLGLGADEIDEVVMVGGMTRTPRVRTLLQSHLGVTHLNVEIDPDVVVAYGTASMAY